LSEKKERDCERISEEEREREPKWEFESASNSFVVFYTNFNSISWKYLIKFLPDI